MKNFKEKLILSLLLAIVLILPSFNKVYAASYEESVKAPRDLVDLVEILENSEKTVHNDLARPDEGSEEIFKNGYKGKELDSTRSTISNFSFGAFGAPSAEESVVGPQLFWNGINNKPTRVAATINGDPKYELGFNWYTSQGADSHVLISKSSDMSNPIKFEAVSMPTKSRFIKRNEDGTIYYDSNGYYYYDDRIEFVYKAKATNLSPDTEYFYQVGSDEEGFGYSPVGTFKTAGQEGQDFSFVHITDTQNW